LGRCRARDVDRARLLRRSRGQRCAQITHISSDSADWIDRVVRRRCPQAIHCADPFHVVTWAQHALDDVRRDSIRQARAEARRQPGQLSRGTALALWRSRHALWKNPANLTEHQAARLDWIAKTDPRLHRAYLLKEGLRYVFSVGPEEGKEALARWLSWARRCRLPSFVKVGRTIEAHRRQIEATLDCGLSNALIESTNTKIRLLTRIAFGFKNADALIGLALLSLGGFCPTLPHTV
jgi:transposase